MIMRHARRAPASVLLALLLLPLLAVPGRAAPAPGNATVYVPLVARREYLLPPDQALGGQSLEQAATLTAAFNVILKPEHYPPGLPYQILNASDTRVFIVPDGTSFYAPIAYVDDSPPIIGNFPSSASAAPAYFFGRDQLGGHDCFITIDGRQYTLGAEYLAGPVTVPPLPDGGGTHYMTLAAFLWPLPPGEHTVSIGSTFDGAAAMATFGAPYSFVVTYTVDVTEPAP